MNCNFDLIPSDDYSYWVITGGDKSITEEQLGQGITSQQMENVVMKLNSEKGQPTNLSALSNGGWKVFLGEGNSRKITQLYESEDMVGGASQRPLTISDEYNLEFPPGKNIKIAPSNRSIWSSVKNAFQEIGRFFKRLRWPTFLVKIAEVFERIFAKERYTERHRNRAVKLMDLTKGKIKASKKVAYSCSGEEDRLYVEVPDEMLLSGRQRHLDRKIGNEEAYRRYYLKPIKPFRSGNHEVTGYHVNKKGDVIKGIVVPGSARLKKSDPSLSNRLYNCYMTHSKGVGIIRTGLVDTPEKADEFKKMAKNLHEEMRGNIGDKIRVMSHQLNSPENENSMIRNQHRSLLKRNSEDFQVGHLNAPSNRFYHVHRKYQQVPGISRVLHGEKKSHQQNVEGMVQYLEWIYEDLEKMGEDDDQIASLASNLKKNVERLKSLKIQIHKKYRNISANEKQLAKNPDKAERKAYEQSIKNCYATINELRQKMIEGDPADVQFSSLEGVYEYLETVKPADKKAAETLHYYRRLLGSQLEIKGEKPLDRNQELLMQFALDNNLNVISAVNCKSGLDRTGFVFALFLGSMDLDEETRFNVINNWEKLTLKLNRRYIKYNNDPAEVLKAIRKPGRVNSKELEAVFHMQQNVLSHLLKVSMPITGISTEMFGLKYKAGPENLLPLYCIPPVITTPKLGRVKIINYDKKGRPTGLTPEGHQLIIQLGLYRGS